MQGVVRSFDPIRAEGIIVSDQDRKEFILAAGALEGSVFRNLRQGQRINFELDGDGNVTQIRIGSEADMGMPSAEI
jgi:cold shock CspA family protein